MKAVQWLLFAIERLPEVTWPGVGRFVKASVPARIDKDGNLILPPTFLVTLQHGDAGATDWIELLVQTGRLHPEQAEHSFRAETEQLNHAISGQPVNLGRYGVLTRSIENRIIFQPAGNIPASNYRETYGLASLPFTLGAPDISAPPIREVEPRKEIAQVLNQPDSGSRVQTIDLRKERRMRSVWPFLIGLLALAGCVFLFWKYRAQIYPSQKPVNDPVVQNQPTVTPDQHPDTTFVQDFHPQNTEPVNDNKIIPKDKPLQQPETQVTVKGNGLTRGVHHIIVYESKSYDNALAKLQELKPAYPLAELSDGANGRYMISIYHSAEQLKAAKEMARLKDVFRNSYRLSL